MTNEEKEKIIRLRMQGLTCAEIGEKMGMKRTTVTTFCSRYNVKLYRCPQCGIVVPQNPNRKPKRFCSDKCRMDWWNRHPEKGNRKPHHTQICPVCHKEFDCFRARGRVYCSRSCYTKSRSGGVNYDAKGNKAENH